MVNNIGIFLNYYRICTAKCEIDVLLSLLDKMEHKPNRSDFSMSGSIIAFFIINNINIVVDSDEKKSISKQVYNIDYVLDITCHYNNSYKFDYVLSNLDGSIVKKSSRLND